MKYSVVFELEASTTHTNSAEINSLQTAVAEPEPRAKAAMPSYCKNRSRKDGPRIVTGSLLEREEIELLERENGIQIRTRKTGRTRQKKKMTHFCS